MLTNLIGFVVAAFVILYTYFKWTFQYWYRRNVPYIEPKFPYGNLSKERIAFPDQLQKLYDTAKENGWKYCGLYISDKPMLFVLDLDLLKLIMTKEFKHFTDRGMYTNEKRDPLTLNLATSDGSKWRSLRPKFSPTFTSGKLKQMFQVIIESGEKLRVYVDDFVKNGEDIDILLALEMFGMDVIGSCAFGIECNTFKDPNSTFVTKTKRHINRSGWTNTKIRLARSFPTLFKLSGLKTVDPEVTAFFTKLVRDTINYRKVNSIRRNDFMQSLIDLWDEQNTDDSKAGETKLTIDEIISQCFLFFNAGFQTTSLTVTYTLFDLTQNENAQEKLRREINEVLAKHNNQITYDSLSDMVYMEQCIKESLRLHDPVAINGRACSEEYVIPGTDVVIEKGMRVMIPTSAIHLDGKYYPDPLKYDPERFSEENSKNRHPYAFIPFGEGPRVCIGARFAMMEAKVGLAFILREYRVKLSRKTQLPLKRKLTTSAISRPAQQIWLKLEKAL